jgi:hypothetical protein
MDDILDSLEAEPLTATRRGTFIVQFVDFLLEHRLEVHMFINQGPSLVDVPVVERANALVRRLAEYFSATTTSTEDRMRFGAASAVPRTCLWRAGASNSSLSPSMRPGRL